MSIFVTVHAREHRPEMTDSATEDAVSPQDASPRRLARRGRRTIIIFSQVFVPDPASVGQHIADVAVELGAARAFA